MGFSFFGGFWPIQEALGERFGDERRVKPGGEQVESSVVARGYGSESQLLAYRPYPGKDPHFSLQNGWIGLFHPGKGSQTSRFSPTPPPKKGCLR